jgi:Response regulator containing a CheY-like receiver domain and an HTH DNA-binding domain
MARTGSARVLIVDEYPLFCMGLSSLLKLIPGYSVVGEATTVADALKIAEKEKPHLIIMEIHLGNENGMELIPQLKSRYPETFILVMSMHDERYYSERILRLGAQGYIMKNATVNNVKEAINTVMAGKVYLSENERERIFEALTGENSRGMKDWANSLRKLSDRELQVFTLIGKGYGTIEIASKFNLSTKTIDTHKEHIKIKLHCNTSQELRQLAIEWANYSASL